MNMKYLKLQFNYLKFLEMILLKKFLQINIALFHREEDKIIKKSYLLLLFFFDDEKSILFYKEVLEYLKENKKK